MVNLKAFKQSVISSMIVCTLMIFWSLQAITAGPGSGCTYSNSCPKGYGDSGSSNDSSTNTNGSMSESDLQDKINDSKTRHSDNNGKSYRLGSEKIYIDKHNLGCYELTNISGKDYFLGASTKMELESAYNHINESYQLFSKKCEDVIVASGSDPSTPDPSEPSVILNWAYMGTAAECYGTMYSSPIPYISCPTPTDGAPCSNEGQSCKRANGSTSSQYRADLAQTITCTGYNTYRCE